MRRFQRAVALGAQIRQRALDGDVRHHALAFDPFTLDRSEADFAVGKLATARQPGVAKVGEQAAAGRLAGDDGATGARLVVSLPAWSDD